MDETNSNLILPTFVPLGLAADLINQKFKTNNIDHKYILSFALENDLEVCVLCREWDVICNLSLVNHHKQNQDIDMDSVYAVNRLINNIKEFENLYLVLSTISIANLLARETDNCSSFEGFLTLDCPSRAMVNNFLLESIDDSYTYDLKVNMEINVSGESMSRFQKRIVQFEGLNPPPIDNDNSVMKICLDDLFISKWGLDFILGGHQRKKKVVSSTQIKEQKVSHRGVSKEKMAAMAKARELALDHWSKEPEEQKTLIGDMAFNIYHELLGLGLIKQLPDIVEMRRWIKPVAPDLACKAGRPKKTPQSSTSK